VVQVAVECSALAVIGNTTGILEDTGLIGDELHGSRAAPGFQLGCNYTEVGKNKTVDFASRIGHFKFDGITLVYY